MIFITILIISFAFTQASRNYSDISTSQNEGIIFSSQISMDLLGLSVRSAGDFNADGFDDFIISSQNAQSTGIIYVIFGSKNGLSDATLSSDLSLNKGIIIYGANPGDQFGFSVSHAGDINGDKIDDIIIGANRYQSATGIAYVIYGSKSPPDVIDLAQGLSSNQGFTIMGSGPLTGLGGAVSWAGDVNNDKIDDVIIGAPNLSNNKGAAYVIFGKKGTRNNIDLSSGLSSSDGFSIIGAADDHMLGTSVSGGGDIDGDGIRDVIIGATGAEGGFGGVYVIYGKKRGSTFSTVDISRGLSYSEGFIVKGGESSGLFGSAVANAGDFNGDGYDDVVVGAPNEHNYQGAVYIIFGQSDRNLLSILDLTLLCEFFLFLLKGLSSVSIDPARCMKIKGATSASFVGSSVNTAGDINGDGISDIIIGAPQENTATGAAYVVFGGKDISSSPNTILSDGLSPKQGFGIIGTSNRAFTGISVASAGDVNGDGMSDLLVGAYGINAMAGAAYLFFTPLVYPENCLTCEKFPICLACEAGYGLYESRCLEKCPEPTELINGVCIPKKSSLEAVTEISQGLFNSGSTASRVFTIGRSLSVGLGLMAKIIQNVRYLNISYPKEALNAFESYGTDLFELPIPEIFYESPDTKELPSQYSRYDISPTFMENYWQTIMTICLTLGCFLLIRVLQYLTRRQQKDEILQVALKNIGQTVANFLVIQIYSNLDDVIFFFLLDASSTKMSSGSAGLSMSAAGFFLLLGLSLIFLHCWVLNKYQQAKQNNQLERFKEKFRILGTLYEDFKDDSATKQSFFGILILRCVFLVLVIMLLQPPWIQASLLMLANLIFLGYFIRQRPFKGLFDEISQYFCELSIFAAYLSVLVLSILDYKEDEAASVREGFGKCIVISGIVLSLGGFVIQIIQIMGAIYGIYKFFRDYLKKERLRSKNFEHLQNNQKKNTNILKGSSQLNDSSQIELRKNSMTENLQFENSGNESFTNNGEILGKASKRVNSHKMDVRVILAEEIQVTQNHLKNSELELNDVKEEETSRGVQKKFKIKPRLLELPS